MKYIDKFLNAITMYRLLLYGLTILAVLGIGFSAIGVLSMSPVGLIISLVLLLVSCWVTNELFSRLFKIPANIESSYITAFILFLIMPPVATVIGGAVVVLAGVIAMASKYVLNVYGKHMFNPAALGVFLIALGGVGAATWWVGSKVMFVPVVILGLLIARKVRRFDVFLAFVLGAIVALIIESYFSNLPMLDVLKTAILSGPLVFFGAIMLTEPFTLPPTRALRYVYGAFVGVLYGTTFHLGILHSSPELALLIGNIYSYMVSSKRRVILKLKEIRQMSPSLYDFAFIPNQVVPFQAGQYWDWTLGHAKPDTRGNRRYFTIASSPTESEIHLGVKIPENPSTFKQALRAMKPGDELLGGQLSGDFTLPHDDHKIVGVAGGIGITPFRSMVKDRIDRHVTTDMVLFYASPDPKDFAYKDILDEGRSVGIKTIYLLSGAKVVPPEWQGPSGYLTKELIEAEVSDYKNRLYYLSGPPVMVDSYKKLLREIGISNSAIHTDYFPGY